MKKRSNIRFTPSIIDPIRIILSRGLLQTLAPARLTAKARRGRDQNPKSRKNLNGRNKSTETKQAHGECSLGNSKRRRAQANSISPAQKTQKTTAIIRPRRGVKYLHACLFEFLRNDFRLYEFRNTATQS
jgi:hypothetical protein